MTLAYPLHATLTGPKVPLSPFLALYRYCYTLATLSGHRNTDKTETRRWANRGANTNKLEIVWRNICLTDRPRPV